MERKISELDAIIDALQNGSLLLTPTTAVSLIDRWQTHLQGSNQPEFQQIASDLAELKRHLTSSDPDQQAIGQMLTRLGTHTSQAATHAGSSAQQTLQQLGALLSRAGNALG